MKDIYRLLELYPLVSFLSVLVSFAGAVLLLAFSRALRVIPMSASRRFQEIFRALIELIAWLLSLPLFAFILDGLLTPLVAMSNIVERGGVRTIMAVLILLLAIVSNFLLWALACWISGKIWIKLGCTFMRTC